MGCLSCGGPPHNGCCTAPTIPPPDPELFNYIAGTDPARAGTPLRERIFRQKFRFDMGAQAMVLINYALLVLSVSDKLHTGLPTWAVVLGAVPGVVLAIWVLGFVLDKMRYGHAYNTELMRRNPVFDEQWELLKRIEAQTRKDTP